MQLNKENINEENKKEITHALNTHVHVHVQFVNLQLICFYECNIHIIMYLYIGLIQTYVSKIKSNAICSYFNFG